MTLIRPFITSDPANICAHLAMVRNTLPITTSGKERALFGHHNDIPVTVLELSEELRSFQKALLDKINPHIEFISDLFFPQFNPHVTDQPTGALEVGDRVTFPSVSLVTYTEEDTREVACTVTRESSCE
jgi:hypothetical protein